jgi:hypothetical protein
MIEPILLVLPILLGAIVGIYLAATGRAEFHRLSRVKEVWKSYALALEVSNECAWDYNVEIDGEGCGTRAKRRDKVALHWFNADIAADEALDELRRLGEYKDD